jgi:hypothetical protein
MPAVYRFRRWEGKMPFPKDCDALKAAGYIFDNDSTCRGCGAEISWYKTPSGKSIPMDPMERGSSPAVAHWATCTDPPERKK